MGLCSSSINKKIRNHQKKTIRGKDKYVDHQGRIYYFMARVGVYYYFICYDLRGETQYNSDAVPIYSLWLGFKKNEYNQLYYADKVLIKYHNSQDETSIKLSDLKARADQDWLPTVLPRGTQINLV